MSANMNKIIYCETESDKMDFDEKYEKCISNLKIETNKFFHFRNFLIIMFIGLFFMLVNDFDLKFILIEFILLVLTFFVCRYQYKKVCIIEVDKWWYENPIDETMKQMEELFKSDSIKVKSNLPIRKLSFVENVYNFFRI